MWCDHFITGYVIDFNSIFNILISSPSSDFSQNTSTHSHVIDACIISLTNILPTSSFSILRYEVVEGHSYILKLSGLVIKITFPFSTNFCFILVKSKILIKSIFEIYFLNSYSISFKTRFSFLNPKSNTGWSNLLPY